MIITIAGRYGCGAKQIAAKLASDLDYSIYDDEIVTAAYETGEGYLNEDELRYYDDSNAEGSVDDLNTDTDSGLDDMPYDVLPLDLRLTAAMQGALNRLADKDNCIFVGRCANFYLRSRSNVISLFFVDEIDRRTRRIMKAKNCGKIAAMDLIEKTDKRRSDYYTYFTGEKWDDADNYDLRVNCDLLGEEGSAELIKTIVDIKEKQLYANGQETVHLSKIFA